MKKKTVIGIVLAAVLLLIVVAAVFAVPKIKAYLPYYYDKTGKHQEDKPYTLTIEKEDFENEVAIRLVENGVICSSARFLSYLKQNYPDFIWYNGIYNLNANMSYKELCEALMKPDITLNYIKFVVPEGKSVRAIATIVEESGLCSAEAFLEAADSYDYNYPFLEELKSRDQNLIGYKLEGFLFPATYEFREDTTSPRDIVDKMLKTFTEYITQDMIQKAQDMGLSLNQFISFGSVVQAEAFSKDSMANVSSVFWNRLNSDDLKRLQSDPTKTYGNSLQNLPGYTQQMKDAYDTYSCQGLPVGPTNCPGVDVLKAVLEPAQTDYYYFVTDKNGKFYFNRTLAEHNQTIRSLRASGLWA